MTDEELFELVKQVDPRAVRLPPGIKAIAAAIELRMAANSTEPAAYFINDAPAGATPHYAQIDEQFKSNPDVFPLYRDQRKVLAAQPVSLPIDGDSEATRAAFRAYDSEYPVTRRSHWQIWRDAIAYAGSVAAPVPGATAKDADTRNDGEQAMQDAAATLPECYDLRIYLERGAGWVELYDSDGKPVEFSDDTNDCMTGRIRTATAVAIEDAEGKGDAPC